MMKSIAKNTLQGCRVAALWLLGFLRKVGQRSLSLLRSSSVREGLMRLRRMTRGLLIGGVLALALVGTLEFGFQRIPPGHVGIRQVNSGSSSGIEAEDHGPGMHFGPRFLNRWHLVDTRVHSLRFAFATEGGNLPTLALRTPEGISVSIAATVPYRILEGRGHRIVAEGLKQSYRLRVRTTAETVLSGELARLSAEEWADTEAREAARLATLELLRTRLESEHVEPLDLRLHGTYFPGVYEKKMQEKQLAAQSRRTAEALARREEQQNAYQRAELALEEERARLVDESTRSLDALRIEKELEIASLQNETLTYTTQRKADADAEYTKLLAEGDRILSEAQSLQDELRAAILESTEGRRFQAAQAAKALNFGSITLDSSDPRLPFVLDIEAMAGVLTTGE